MPRYPCRWRCQHDQPSRRLRQGRAACRRPCQRSWSYPYERGLAWCEWSRPGQSSAIPGDGSRPQVVDSCESEKCHRRSRRLGDSQVLIGNPLSIARHACVATRAAARQPYDRPRAFIRRSLWEPRLALERVYTRGRCNGRIERLNQHRDRRCPWRPIAVTGMGVWKIVSPDQRAGKVPPDGDARARGPAGYDRPCIGPPPQHHRAGGCRGRLAGKRLIATRRPGAADSL